MAETWYRVAKNLYEDRIDEIAVFSPQFQTLVLANPDGTEGRRELIDTGYYRTFPTRPEAVRYVELRLSVRVREAQATQRSAISSEKSFLNRLAAWREKEQIIPEPGTVGGPE